MATNAVEIKVHSQENDNFDPPPSTARLRPLAFSVLFEIKLWMKLSARQWLLPSFLVANVIMFIVTMYVNNCPMNSDDCIARFLGRFSFESFKRNPLLGPSGHALEKMGGLEVNKIVYEKQVWLLFSSMWLHAGVLHILSNMLTLLYIGLQLEQEFGFVRIGLLYVTSGFGASLSSALFIRSGISVGASGALMGLIGGMLSELLTNWTIYTNRLTALLTLVLLSISSIAFSIIPFNIIPRINNFAHIGGLLSGFLCGFVFLVRPQYGWVSQKNAPPGCIARVIKPKHKAYQYVLWIVSLMLLIAGFSSGFYLLLKGIDMNDQCSWCRYLNCVPISKWKCDAR